MEYCVKELAEKFQGEIIGNHNIKVTGLAGIDQAEQGDISFIESYGYTKKDVDVCQLLEKTNASVVLINKNFKIPDKVEKTLILVENAYFCFIQLLNEIKPIHDFPESNLSLPETTKIGNGVKIGIYSVIGQRCDIGNGIVIYPQVFIGNDVEIGEGTVIYPGVKIYHGTKIGKNCIIHAGAVIGSDGFGFLPYNGKNLKINQIGRVIIDDNVEIGANTTIDRGALGNTHIFSEVKLDNLVQIGHNVEVGTRTMMSGQSGIAGSSKVGKDCLIGGQAGIADHVVVGDKVYVAGQSGITKSFKYGHVVLMGTPAINQKQYLRSYAKFKNN